MPKTAAPGNVVIPHVGDVVLNAVPDPFDERDLEYRPRLQPLPVSLDQRKNPYVMLQKSNSCVGHALATMINTVLRRTRVSPYMLYHLARRYDEFEGEEDLGSSLRGGLKGWFNHGVALARDWPSLESVPDIDEPTFVAKCRRRPLGAFYRVNAFRLDDMQSAVCELNGIVASAAIHQGWINPEAMKRARSTMRVIARPDNARALGGHAFAIVGYNEVGFLIQNSWGTDWGKGGFATLPYEDWLDSAYDAWVARPGVPNTPFASGRTRTAPGTWGNIATAPGPDIRRLQHHVVNLGNNGRLSAHGRFVSTNAQVEAIFANMDQMHSQWAMRTGRSERHVVIYAHGGLVSESAGLATAQKHLDWWLNNCVYPINFAWQSGAVEVITNRLADMMRVQLPAGGLGFDLAEQFDRLVEMAARKNLQWMWAEMKQNARAASQPITNPDAPSGGTLVADHLARYVAKHSAENVRVHLVGHSAGSIFHAAFLQRLIGNGIRVESLTFMAPALRVDKFESDVLPEIGRGVRRFTNYVLSDRLELDDFIPRKQPSVYQKSLLYLVSRGFEERPAGARTYEVPLVGMARFLNDGLPTPAEQIKQKGGVIIESPTASPANSTCDAKSHGAFDDDVPTMTSVLLRILDVATPQHVHVYQPNAARAGCQQAPEATGSASDAMVPTSTEPLAAAASVAAPGSAPLVQTEGSEDRIGTTESGRPSESLIRAELEGIGWQMDE